MNAASMESGFRHCEECGQALPAGEPGCPACLLRLAFSATDLEAALPGADGIGKAAARARERVVGRPFGRYRMLAEAGRGGMGVVYRARQEGLGRDVAVKLLVAGPFAMAEHAERLRTEAVALGRLRHPGIVAVHEAGVAEGQPYLVMEWVEGESLAARMTGGPLLAGEAVRLLVAIGEAVEHAHAAGVWHRDLKPANILIDRDGRPRVTDFGLAKLVDEPSGLTLSGVAMGTPGYLAPEQIDGRNGALGPWTDIYALGAVLYHSLTGRPVFGGGRLQETLRQTVECDPAAPRTLNPAIPMELEVICLKCLEREPGRRYATVSELLEDLRRHQDGRVIRARPVGLPERWVRWGRRHPVVAAAAGVAILAAGFWAGTVTWLWRDAAAAAERANRVAAQLRRERIEDLFEQGNGRRALAQWGELLAADRRDRVVAARVVSAMAWRNPPVPVRVVRAHAREVTALEVEPGGGRVLSASRDGTVRVWGAAGAGDAMLRWEHGAPVGVARWVGGGRGILTGADDGSLCWWDGEDGRRLRAWALPGPVRLAEGAVEAGASVRVLGVGSEAAVRVWSAEAAGDVPVEVRLPGEVEVVRFSRSGDRWAVGCGDGLARVFEADSGMPAGPELVHEQRVVDVMFDGEGRRLATASWDGRVRLWDPERGEMLAESPRFGSWATGVRGSPDGREWLIGGADWRVGLWRPGELGRDWVIWRHDRPVMALDYTTDGRRVLSGSPDGMVRVREAVTGEERVLPVVQDGTLTCARWAGGGEWVVTADDRGVLSWWDVRPRRPEPVALPHAPMVQAAWAGNGGRVVTVGRDRVARVWDAGTGRPVFATPTNATALATGVLSGDGTRLLVAGRDGRSELWDLETGERRDLVPRHRRGVWRGVFGPGSRWLATVSWDGDARVWEAGSGRSVGPAYPHTGPISAVAFDPEGGRLSTGTREGDVRVWRPPAGEPEAGGRWHQEEVTAVAFSPDGRWLLSASLDRRVLLTALDGRGSSKELDHDAGVMAAAFAPDGRTVATGGVGGVVRLWGVTGGVEAGPILVHGGLVNGLAFDPGSRRLVTVASDGWVRLWDVGTGLLLGRLEVRFSSLLAAEFDPAGQRLLVGSEGEGVTLWPVRELPVPVPDWLPRWIGALCRSGEASGGGGSGPETEEWLLELERSDAPAEWKDWGRRFLDPGATGSGAGR